MFVMAVIRNAWEAVLRYWGATHSVGYDEVRGAVEIENLDTRLNTFSLVVIAGWQV